MAEKIWLTSVSARTVTIRAGLATKKDSRTSVFWPFTSRMRQLGEQGTEADDGADGDEAGKDAEHSPISLRRLVRGSIITGRSRPPTGLIGTDRRLE